MIDAGYTIDEKVFKKFAAGLSIVTGDFTDSAIYEKIGEAVQGKGFAAHYLAIPPSLFDKVTAGLAQAGLNKNARLVGREALRPRPGLGPAAGSRPGALLRPRPPGARRPLPGR